jgi:pimeloyl-ACP methyl ester carboxylesterase
MKTFLKRAFLSILALIVLGGTYFYFRPSSVFGGIRKMQLAAAKMESRDAVIGGHRIHYIAGGDGPPLLLIHGVASRSSDWADLLPELTKTHRVYALDLLGHGDSDRPTDSDYSITTHTEKVLGLMDHLQLAKPDIMGVSMGGWIAMKLASEHPERVQRLVLVSSAGLAFETKINEATFAPQSIDELRATLAMQTDRSVPDFLLRDFLRESKKKSWVHRRTLQSILTRGELLDGKLQRVTMPVLLVWGTKDKVVPFAVAGKLQKELPQARLVKLDGCGHLALIECTDRMMPKVSAFLR